MRGIAVRQIAAKLARAQRLFARARQSRLVRAFLRDENRQKYTPKAKPGGKPKKIPTAKPIKKRFIESLLDFRRPRLEAGRIIDKH